MGPFQHRKSRDGSDTNYRELKCSEALMEISPGSLTQRESQLGKSPGNEFSPFPRQAGASKSDMTLFASGALFKSGRQWHQIKLGLEPGKLSAAEF